MYYLLKILTQWKTRFLKNVFSTQVYLSQFPFVYTHTHTHTHTPRSGRGENYLYTAPHWWDLRSSRAGSLDTASLWWDFYTARTRCCWCKCCVRYTGKLKTTVRKHITNIYKKTKRNYYQDKEFTLIIWMVAKS